ncbi:hypothetical protein MUK42_01907, partial [Musa troglodytarum]
CGHTTPLSCFPCDGLQVLHVPLSGPDRVSETGISCDEWWSTSDVIERDSIILPVFEETTQS